MTDMRKKARVPSHCPVVVKVLTVDGTPQKDVPPCYCHASDLSAEGIRLVLAVDLAFGAQVELVVVMLDPPATFRHVGVVRWHRTLADGQKNSAGIEFTASSPKVMQMWVRMMAERYPSTRTKPQQRYSKDADSVW